MVVGAGVGGDEDVAGEGGDGLEDGRQRVPARQWHRGDSPPARVRVATRGCKRNRAKRRWMDGWGGVHAATPAEAGCEAGEEGSKEAR